MDSRQARIFDRIQPGLASMGVKDQAAMAAARILADAEQVAAGKVDVAQKALTMAQTELDGVRALVRAAQGEGASMRTDARLMASLAAQRGTARTTVGDDGTTERTWLHVAETPANPPEPKACPSALVHPPHTWRFVDSSKVWACPGLPAVPPEDVCTRGMLGAHEAHGTCPGSGPLVPAGPDRFA